MDSKLLPKPNKTNSSHIGICVQQFVNDYISKHDKQERLYLYHRVLDIVEPTLLNVVMAHCQFKQAKVARALGLSRAVTRQKLIRHFGNKYCSRG